MTGFSTRVAKITSRVMSPKLRDECFVELSRTGLRHGFLGMKPLPEKEQKELRTMIDKASTQAIEALYLRLFPLREDQL